MKHNRLNKRFSGLEDCPKECPPPYPSRFDCSIKNKTFNHLTALYPVKYDGKMQWVCQCNNCGGYYITTGKYLRSGHCKSCGCIASQKLRKDLTGKIIDGFEVLQYSFSISDRQLKQYLRGPCWLIKCPKCGLEFVESAEHIQRHSINCPQCDCNAASQYESKKALIILNTLKNSDHEHLRNVKTEYKFDNCFFKNKLPFDFYIPAFTYPDGLTTHEFLIEYDGPQHDKPSTWFGALSDTDSYKDFIGIQVRDWIKDMYCIEHDIPLIRIKHGSRNCKTWEEVYANSYIVGSAQGYDKIFDCYDIIENDIINNCKFTFNISSGIHCTFKCCKECGSNVCQNSELTKRSIVHSDIDTIINKYLSQNISKCITFQGLEPLDNLKQLLWFIYYFRKISNDDIIIWTGYTKKECDDLLHLITSKMKWSNIIIKFGRFVPNQKPHYDEVLGIELISDNQFAERIS